MFQIDPRPPYYIIYYIYIYIYLYLSPLLVGFFVVCVNMTRLDQLGIHGDVERIVLKTVLTLLRVDVARNPIHYAVQVT